MTTRFEHFRELHRQGTFVVVNVWDPGSAVLAERAGAVALATTSSGQARSLARRDARHEMSRDEMVERTAAICAAVNLPVTVDAENGWAHEPSEVAETVRLLADAGAAGAGIEDWSGDDGIGTYDSELAVERIEAAVEAARSLPDPFVVVGRSDVCLHDGPDALDEAITRLQRFAAAGAECLFAPGTRDIGTITRVVDEAGGPVNALIGIGSELTVPDVTAIGVRRVSLGGSLQLAAMAEFRTLVEQVVSEGRFDCDLPLPRADDFLPTAG